MKNQPNRISFYWISSNLVSFFTRLYVYIFNIHFSFRPKETKATLTASRVTTNNTNSLNLALYTLMTQSVAHTMRSSAKEAEFYITRHGRMKTASGSLAITSGRYIYTTYRYAKVTIALGPISKCINSSTFRECGTCSRAALQRKCGRAEHWGIEHRVP